MNTNIYYQDGKGDFLIATGEVDVNFDFGHAKDETLVPYRAGNFNVCRYEDGETDYQEIDLDGVCFYIKTFNILDMVDDQLDLYHGMTQQDTERIKDIHELSQAFKKAVQKMDLFLSSLPTQD